MSSPLQADHNTHLLSQPATHTHTVSPSIPYSILQTSTHRHMHTYILSHSLSLPSASSPSKFRDSPPPPARRRRRRVNYAAVAVAAAAVLFYARTSGAWREGGRREGGRNRRARDETPPLPPSPRIIHIYIHIDALYTHGGMAAAAEDVLQV